MLKQNYSKDYRGEYIIKAKKTQIEYEINRKFDFKLFINPVIWGVVGIIIYILIDFRRFNEIMNTDIPNLNTNFNINDRIRMMVFVGLGLLISILFFFGIISVINDKASRLRKIILKDASIFIKTLNNEYEFSYENLIKIRVGILGLRRNLFSKYCLYIYYLKNNEINEFRISFPRQNLEKIKEICSMFITNMNNEEIDLNQYCDVRTKEQDDIIKKILNDEIVW